MTERVFATAGPARVHVAQVNDLRITTVVTGRWRENCHVVRSVDGQTVVIDPGGDADQIVAAVGDGRVEAILCTHGHYDHIGVAAELTERFNTPCRIDGADLDLVRQAPLYAMSFDGVRVRTPRAVQPLGSGPRLHVGADEIKPFPCPGHTRGSTAFLVGDAVFTGDTLMFEAVGRTDLPGGDPDAIHGSIARLLAAAAPSGTLFTGHGPPWTIREALAWLSGRPR
jgi:glyoxylase-like metal-dependent hydrolase (beta-lactamase superfamily II)